MREIVLDTETTGLSPLQGHRIVEIGCIELQNHVATGEKYHVYINPGAACANYEEAQKVHGLTPEFLADKPLFTEIVDAFLTFIAGDPLVIHNAAFDMGFINAEMTRAGFATLPSARAIDTLAIARKKFFGAPASLDALCKRFGIDTSHRSLHGALLDAELLAEVYLELCGGRQTSMMMPEETAALEKAAARSGTTMETLVRSFLPPRHHQPTTEETAAHEDFLTQIKNALWKRA
jgi:DNA polymerase-3 subunit epsilon